MEKEPSKLKCIEPLPPAAQPAPQLQTPSLDAARQPMYPQQGVETGTHVAVAVSPPRSRWQRFKDWLVGDYVAEQEQQRIHDTVSGEPAPVPESVYVALLASNTKVADGIYYAVKKDCAVFGIPQPGGGYGSDVKRAALDTLKVVGALKTQVEQLKRQLPKQ